jgi:hypothetical protein
LKVDSERLGAHGVRIVTASALLALLGGVVYVAVQPLRISGAFLFAAIPLLGFLLAVALGLPGLFAGAAALRRRDRRRGLRNLLFFLGPLAVLLGTEVVPHLLNPCLLSEAFGRTLDLRFCERITYREGFGGKGALAVTFDVRDRWHFLHHALAGAVPLAFAYRGTITALGRRQA